MGKKYIIEIPEDKLQDFVGSTHFLMPYMIAGHIGHHDTGLPIKPYTEPDLEQVRKEAYEKENGEQIQVGDEIEAVYGKAVVIEVIDGGQAVRYMYPDTITGRNKACYVTRTGRHFPEIAEVLQKMKEKA